LSFIPPGSDSGGTEILISSGVGFAAPSVASASARSFPSLELCPLTHLSQVRADRHLMAYAAALIQGAFGTLGHPESSHWGCQDRFSSTILLGGPGMQGTNEEVSPDTSRCWLVRTIKSGSYGRSPGTREALGVSPGFCGVSPDHGKVVQS